MNRTALFLLIFSLLWFAPTVGQDAVEQPPEEAQLPPLVITGNELTAKWDDAFTRIESLQETADAAAGEDLRILNRQIIDGKIELLDTLHKLRKNLLAQQKAGLPTGESRTRAAL